MRPKYLSALAIGALLAACGDREVPAEPEPPTVTLTASTAGLNVGESVTLNWSSTNANTCAATGGWSGERPTSGSQTFQVNYAGAHTYTLTCSGDDGFGSDDVTVSATGNPAISLSVTPSYVVVGETATVTWSTAAGQACTATEDWSGPKPSSGSEAIPIVRQGQNYLGISCNGPQGPGYAGVPLYATAIAMSLTATPETLTSREVVTLEWSSTNAVSCEAEGDWTGTKAADGTQQVRLTQPGAHPFTLRCGDFSDQNVKTVTVQVNPEALAFKAFPAKLHVGDPVTLNWAAQDAAGCTAGGAWSGALPAQGTQTLTVASAGTSTYEITCGAENRAVDVLASAAPALPPAANFRLTPNHAGAVDFATSPTFPGSQTWSVELDGELAYPLIAEGLVFATSRDPYGNYGMFLRALDADDGTTAWGPVAIPGTYWYANLAYEDGTLFVLNHDGALRAFDAATGTEQWSVEVPNMYAFTNPPTIMGGMIFVSTSGGVSALDASNGDVLWHNRNAPVFDASPTVVSSGLYVTSKCSAYDFLPVTGALIWKVLSGCTSPFGDTVPVRDGRLYAYLLQGLAGDMDILDAASGAPLAASSALFMPAVAATRYFVVDLQGVLHGIDVATHEVLWSFAGDGELYTSPIVINDRVIVGSRLGNIYAVDAATGTQQWAGVTAAGAASEPLWDGITAGEGWLVVPAGKILTAWKLVP